MKRQDKNRTRNVSPGTILLVRQVFMGLLFFGLLALIISGVWYGSRLPSLTITEIKASGGSTIKSENVVAKAEAVLEGNYIGLVPRRFVYLYPEQAVLEAVSTVRRIKDVHVEKIDNQTLAITYSEYVPDALWCSLEEESSCLFLDREAFAFTQAPKLTGESLLRFYTLQTEPTEGDSALTIEDYNKIKEFALKLNASSWYVNRIETDTVRDAFLTLAEGGEIKVTLKDDLNHTFSLLESLRQSKEFAHLAPGKFRYLDMRFGTKIFVNENLVDELDPTESATTSTAYSAEDFISSTTSILPGTVE